MSEKTEQKIIDAVIDLDLNKFSPDAYDGIPPLRKKLANSLFFTRLGWSGGAALATTLFAWMTTQNSFVGVVGVTVILGVWFVAAMLVDDEPLLTDRGYYRSSVVPLYRELVATRISEFELKTGGIYKLTSFLDTSNLDAKTLEKYLLVFNKSKSAAEIKDYRSYYKILVNIKETLSKKEALEKKAVMIASLEAPNWS